MPPQQTTKPIMKNNLPIAFIIGAPRSGTTILCDVLGEHREIESISEPYFIWDWKSGGGLDDVRTAADVTPENAGFIRREFSHALENSGKKILVEKTPENCFRVPFMHEVFPEAKWIFLYRNGLDVIASMNIEWRRRVDMVQKRDLKALWKTAKRMVMRQKHNRHRVLALIHEATQNFSLKPGRLFNKAKWQGRAAWGPRFPGWQQELDRCDNPVAFNARQWAECSHAARAGLEGIDPSRILRISYEDLVQNREETIREIETFLSVDHQPDLGAELSPSSLGKWKSYFSKDDVALIESIIETQQSELGYKRVS